MSNSNKTEINKQYGEVMNSLVNTTAASSHTLASNIYPTYSESVCTNDNTSYSPNIEIIHVVGGNKYSSNNYLNYTRNNIPNMKIKDIEIVVPNKVVKVIFEDETFEKAVCHEDDVFSLETAITICLAKHAIGGSSKYNNSINKAIKNYTRKCEKIAEEKDKIAKMEAKRKKNHLKKLKLRERKEALARSKRIQEQAEVIKLAHDLINTVNKTEEE